MRRKASTSLTSMRDYTAVMCVQPRSAYEHLHVTHRNIAWRATHAPLLEVVVGRVALLTLLTLLICIDILGHLPYLEDVVLGDGGHVVRLV